MEIRLFDLNLLRALDVLLQERNVTRAAQRLHVTQQAMSGALKRLRDHFGDDLLVRVGRSLQPTPVGTALAEPVRLLLQQVATTLSSLPVFDPATSDRHFKIAMSDYATLAVLPHLIANLARAAPRFVCEVEPIKPDMFDDLDKGQLDFGLMPSSWHLLQHTQPEGIVSCHLYDDDFVCVIDNAHAPIDRPLTRSEYLAAPHSLVRFGGGLRSVIENSWLEHGLTPRVMAVTSSFASQICMVPGTPLIATVQRRLARQFASLLPVTVVECPVPIATLRGDLHWSRRNDADPAHRFMRDMFDLAMSEMDSVSNNP